MMEAGAEREKLEADLAAAKADLERVRTENAALAGAFHEEPTEERRELLRRGAESLAAARDRAEGARAALQIFERTGSPYGVVPTDGSVVGVIAVVVKPGSSREQRARAICDALASDLSAAAVELGAVLGAAPDAFTRERPGRDAEGRTVLEVKGRVEGDVLVPAVSKAARTRS